MNLSIISWIIFIIIAVYFHVKYIDNKKKLSDIEKENETKRDNFNEKDN